MDDLGAPWNWVGRYRVWFTNTPDLLTEGGDHILDIDTAIVDANGQPLFLKTYDGRMYNWQTIIAIKKV